ncbi:Ankyrin repeat domain containing protein [Pandoravirus neocaledonia]|uniref:Ankyrin repeat domain containing protein n=1 Tax=Pandoravirus neocaledonia TaxID=2107708 RepID=A0A2U7UDZ5_9VIRU|nr:Ankyrin repeat domain containing protein [Pandoravirus neocaledonia]AVK76632.1 Ankyrin repeat domain containing protein [Pandoravirus neocaledonia]
MNDLPDELLVSIFSFLPCVVAGKAPRAVDKRWRRILDDTHPSKRPPCVSGVDLRNTSMWCKTAAAAGHLSCLRHAHEAGHIWGRATCAAAAANGHKDCLVYARENGCNWDRRTCIEAAKNGHLDCLDYALRRQPPWDKTNAAMCTAAAAGGHISVLEYLRDLGHLWDRRTFVAAVAQSHVDILAFLWSHGCPSAPRAKTIAASRGHVACLRFLHDKEGYRDEDRDAMAHAIAAGHGDCVTFLRENGYTCGDPGLMVALCARRRRREHGRSCRSLPRSRSRPDSPIEPGLADVLVESAARRSFSSWERISMCHDAASVGHTPALALMAGLRTKDRTHHVCKAAALGGHLETLRYARSQGWPFSLSMQFSAKVAAMGHLDVVRYIYKEERWCSNKRACRAAAANGHTAVFAYLRFWPPDDRGPRCEWDPVACMQAAASGGRLGILRYIHDEERFPWALDLCQRAAAGGHLDCLRYLCENGSRYDAKTYAAAAERQRRACLAYLNRIGCPKPPT